MATGFSVLRPKSCSVTQKNMPNMGLVVTNMRLTHTYQGDKRKKEKKYNSLQSKTFSGPTSKDQACTSLAIPSKWCVWQPRSRHVFVSILRQRNSAKKGHGHLDCNGLGQPRTSNSWHISFL
jgi:hypothetical protein